MIRIYSICSLFCLAGASLADSSLFAQTFRVDQVTPYQHSTDGGAQVRFHGEGFDSNLVARIDGALFPDFRVLGETLAVATMPALTSGVYDIRFEPQGKPVVVVGDAIECMDALLPPVSDVSCVRGACEATIRWTNWVDYDEIEILRNGDQIAILTGKRTRFDDVTLGCSADHFVAAEYTIVGRRGGLASHPARCEAVNATTRPAQAAYLNSQRASTTLLSLQGEDSSGEDSSEVQTVFRLGQDASGIDISVLGQRKAKGGALRARIRSLTPSREILIDDILMTGISSGAVSQHWAEAHVEAELDAGEYVLGFYVEGGDSSRTHFHLFADASLEDLGEPYPCPPYPLARVFPLLAGNPPVILGVRPLLTHPDSLNIPMRRIRRGFGASLTGPRLSVLAIDTTPESAVQFFEIDFGDGSSAISGSPIVNHFYKNSGSYSVTVKATSVDGASSRWTRVIPVGADDVDISEEGHPPIIINAGPSAPETFIPGVDSEVDFYVSTRPWALTSIASVRFLFRNGTRPMVQVAGQERDRSGVNKRWVGRFNFSDLAADLASSAVIIRVTDALGEWSEIELPIQLCPIPGLDNFADRVSFERWGGYRIEYRFPDDPIFHNQLRLPLINPLDTTIDLNVSGAMQFSRGVWTRSPLLASMDAEVIDIDLFRGRSWTVPWQTQFLRGCRFDAVGFRSHEVWRDRKSISTGTRTFFDGWVGGIVKVRVRGSATFGLEGAVEADINVETSESAPHLSAEVLVTPSLTGDLHAVLRAEVYWGLASVQLDIRPSVGMAWPLELRVEDDIEEVTQLENCYHVDLRVGIEACAWACYHRTKRVFDHYEPESCRFGNGGGGGIDPGEERVLLRQPSISVSPDGSLSIMTYIKNGSSDSRIYDPEIYYTVDDGRGWQEPRPMNSRLDDLAQSDARVVFVDDDTAFAVWTQNRMKREDMEALRDAVNAEDPRFASEVFNNQEIVGSFWTLADGWSEAIAITNDFFPDGSARVTAIPGKSSVAIVWVRSEMQDIVGASGYVSLDHMSIYAATVDPEGRVSPAEKISLGPDPVAEMMPTVAWSPDGTNGYAVWAFDKDGDVETFDDKGFAFAHFDGNRWQRAVQIFGVEIPGASMPHLTMNSNDSGVLAFTAKEADCEQLSTADMRDTVHASVLVGGEFLPPAPLRRARCDRGGKAFGRWPIVKRMDGDRSVVVFRSLDPEDGSLDGDVSSATVDLSSASPRWSEVKDLVQDDILDVEVAVDLDPRGNLRLVRNCVSPEGQGGAASFDGLVLSEESLDPDLALSAIRVSNSHPVAGERIEITFVLKNTGLVKFERPDGPGPHYNTRFAYGFVVDGAVPPIETFDVEFHEPPGGTMEIVRYVTAPAGSQRLSAAVDLAEGEANGLNNFRWVPVGALVPEEVSCALLEDDEGPNRVLLEWKNSEFYDQVLIYRDDQLVVTLPAGSMSHIEVGVSAGEHIWDIVGRIRDSMSSRDVAICELSIEETFVMNFMRGEANDDGRVDLSDAIYTLLWLFAGGPDFNCDKAADSNDDGGIDISDPLFSLNVLFLGGTSFPEPNDCGLDSSVDGLSCEQYFSCGI